MIVLGIDPGLTGALAWYQSGQVTGRLVTVQDMPVSGKEVDPYQLRRLLDPKALSRANVVVIERQQSMPKQGVSTTFKLGMSYGVVLGAVAALGYRIELVSPGVWKRVMKVTKDKDMARQIASRAMPEGASFWPLKRHHGRAEAALIALYGAMQQRVGRAA